MARTSTSFSMPCARSRAAVTGPTPHSASIGSPCRKRSTRSGAMTVSPSGFCQPEAILARNLFGATPAEAVRPVSSRMRAFNRSATVRPSGSAPGVVGDVEVGLVERERLDQRRHLAIDREDLQRHRAVFLELGPDDDQVRAQAHGMRHRHGRADAELARLVAGRRDDAPAGRRTAHHHRPPPQRRVVALFHGRVEGVHVDVENPAHCRFQIADCRLRNYADALPSCEFRQSAICNLQSAITRTPPSYTVSFGTPISLTAADTVSMKRGVGSTPFSRAAARSWDDSAGPQA